MNLHNAKITMVIDDETYEIKPDDINITFMEHGLGHHVSIGGRLTLVSVNVAGVEEKVMNTCDVEYIPNNSVQEDVKAFQREMMDELIKAFEVPNNVLFPVPTMVPRTDDHKGCNHKWKNYRGFSESYQYCEKCPEKKPLEDS